MAWSGQGAFKCPSSNWISRIWFQEIAPLFWKISSLFHNMIMQAKIQRISYRAFEIIWWSFHSLLPFSSDFLFAYRYWKDELEKSTRNNASWDSQLEIWQLQYSDVVRQPMVLSALWEYQSVVHHLGPINKMCDPRKRFEKADVLPYSLLCNAIGRMIRLIENLHLCTKMLTLDNILSYFLCCRKLKVLTANLDPRDYGCWYCGSAN